MVARSRTGLVALVLAAGLALTGCTGSGEPRSSVALEVGDRTVSVDQLQDVVRILGESSPDSNLGGNEAGVMQQQLLSQVVMVELKGEVLSREGIEVDRAELADVKRQLSQNFDTMPDWMIDVAARFQLLNPQDPAQAQQLQGTYLRAMLGDDYEQQLQQGAQDELVQTYERELRQVASDLGMQLNPRYGEFNPEADLQGQPVINAQGGQLAEFTEPEAPEQPIIGQ